MSDLIFSLITMVYSILLITESFKLPRGIANIPGPGFFPRIVAFVIMALSAILILKSILMIIRRKASNVTRGNWVKSAAIIGAALAYVMTWGRGNFLFNTFIFLFLIQLVTNAKWYIAMLSSLALSISIFLLFGKVFNVILF